jgi:hypothetical protein
VLINLVPEFLDVLRSPDSAAAYRRYHDNHRLILDAYWRNYVLDPDSRPADEVVRNALRADRRDLYSLLEHHDLEGMVEEAIAKAREVLRIDRPSDVYLMVGMGAANAGELVVNGRGAAFICLEHFTGRVNPESHGLGLSPKLIPLWVGHELAHAVRYTSPESRSDIARIVGERGGYYDFWDIGSRATLRELLVNEGLAVHAAQAVAPGLDLADYFGYPRRQFTRLREIDAFLRRAVRQEIDKTGLGLRLRYLSDGMSPSARIVGGRVIPERSGYYVGWRMTEALVAERGIAEALRTEAKEFAKAEERARGVQSA